jgi:hypothetical protein
LREAVAEIEWAAFSSCARPRCGILPL